MATDKKWKNHVHFIHKLKPMKDSQEFIRKLKAEQKQANYDVVRSIISSMNSTEIRFAKGYLMLLHTSGFESRFVKLFRYILRYPTNEETQAREFFNSDVNVNFDMIVSDLKHILSWTLIAEYNTQKNGAYSDKWQTLFVVKNNLIIYQVMLLRELSGGAFDLLNETIVLAKEIEAFREWKEALEYKIRDIQLKSENRKITRLNEELDFCTVCENALNEAKKIYYDVGTLQRKLGHKHDELLDHCKNSEDTLNELYQKTKSYSILYFYLFAKANTFQVQRDYVNAGKVLFELNKIVTESIVLKTKNNLGRVAISLADNSLYQTHFEVALTYCRNAKSNYVENTYNFFQAEFLEFYAYFYSNQFYLAELKLIGILENPKYQESDFLVNTKKYLLACTYFAREKYTDALSVLVNIEKIWSDTTGWNVGVRIMIMLCYKMLNNYEFMALERDRFKALFDKYRHQTKIAERDKIILKIIREFLKQNSDFKSIYKRKEKEFKLLINKENEWKSMSHEMIVFDQWFICMMHKSKYRLEI
ncbi:MAG: hypothetical protein ABIQ40_00360 [Bacteroidia bacterium]